jgi:hypothetical protein
MGVSIPFTTIPTNSAHNRPYQLDQSSQTILRGFVQDMLRQEVVVPVDRRDDQVVYPFFLVENKDKSLRGILNVKQMNEECLQTKKFKMETLMRVLPLIRPGDWFGSWDLRKGYYNVAVHPDFQRFFCFELEGQRYMFKCLVMGISIAPFIFSKLMAALVHFARAAGIDVSFYLDDTLVRGPSYPLTWRDLRAFGGLLQLAGFLLHEDKSVAEPTQTITYLGFIICSTSMTIQLPTEKEKKIRQALSHALRDAEHQTPWTVRDAAQLIGWLLAAIPAVRYGQGHFQSLENVKKWALLDAGNNYDARTVLWGPTQVNDLQWWLNLPSPIQRYFQKREFTAEFTTDASLEGWGVVFDTQAFSGMWDDTYTSIDELELATILVALEILPVLTPSANLRVFCDNTVAIAYVNHMGGKVGRLNIIARRIWDLLETHNAFLTATYLASAQNVADPFTRGFSAKTRRFFDLEVQLNPTVFASHVRNSGPFSPEIDWFASCHNKQLPRFCAWQEGVQGAECIDALQQDWSQCPGYMFPPFSLLPKVLRKIRDERAHIILVHPNWLGALWAPTLQSK